MARIWMLVAALALGGGALLIGSGQIHQDFAGHPIVELITILGLVVVAPALLLAHPWTIFLFPFAAGAIVFLAWKRFVGKNELAGKVLFLVWVWSGFIFLGVMIATDFSDGAGIFS